MASNGRRVVSSWKFPEGLLMKAVAIKLYDDGLRGRALEQAFERLVPQWRSYFPKPISSNAIAQRADKARRYPHEFEAVRPYWTAARKVVRANRPLGKRAVRALVAPRPRTRTHKLRLVGSG
jgi:hypothetical protein